jgi:TfoX/Sxy family transcriptional regulator of competence genes
MAFSETLAAQIRAELQNVPQISERKMFGGLCFTLGGNMLVGVVGNELVARVGKASYEAALAQPGARPMDFTGRPMKGYVFIAPAGLAQAQSLRGWIEAACHHVSTLPVKAPRKNAAAKGSAARKRSR